MQCIMYMYMHATVVRQVRLWAQLRRRPQPIHHQRPQGRAAPWRAAVALRGRQWLCCT